MPFQECLWLEDEHDLAHAVTGAATCRPQFGSEYGQRELLAVRDSWRVRMFTLEDAELLPKQKDFEIFLVIGPPDGRGKVKEEDQDLGEGKVDLVSARWRTCAGRRR